MFRLLFALVAFTGPLAAADRGVWLCVGPESWMEGVQPLCDLRASQGWQVVKSSKPAAEAISGQSVKPSAILLLGDDPAAPLEAPWVLPAERRPYHGWLAKHPAEFASDAARGDLDADQVPDVPVGRIPGRTPEEIAAVVRKILAWEARVPSPDDLTIPFWAGDPGFGKVGSVMKLGWLPFFIGQLRDGAPPWAGFWFLQSEPRSPFCGWPLESAATFNQRLAGGSLFSAMIGHGRVDSWWIMNVGNERLRYRAADARSMASGAPAAPHIVFACRCGDFADPNMRCLAEEFLFAPAGPVACIAASVDSHPLTNYYGSTSLLRGLKAPPADTFGQVWVESIRRAHFRREPVMENIVSSLESVIIGEQNRVQDLKADHLLIYNLLGDPATRLFFPRELEAEVVERDGRWQWSVAKPASLPPGAKLVVQYRAPFPSFKLRKPPTGREASVETLEQANAALTFRTLDELGADEAWRGTLDGPGTLRLCVTGGPALFVHATELKQ